MTKESTVQSPTLAHEYDSEWRSISVKVVRALRRGYTSEESIANAARLDPHTTRAALKLLGLVGQVEQVRRARWHGLTLQTARYGSRTRKRLLLGSTEGRPSRDIGF